MKGGLKTLPYEKRNPPSLMAGILHPYYSPNFAAARFSISRMGRL